jgi:mediator of RNA polymerase II transcription subunit 14
MQVPFVYYCQQLGSTLSSHETCFTQTADLLFFMHEGLQQAKAHIFDVPSAIKVMLTGAIRGWQDALKMLKVKTNFSHMKNNMLSKN